MHINIDQARQNRLPRRLDRLRMQCPRIGNVAVVNLRDLAVLTSTAPFSITVPLPIKDARIADQRRTRARRVAAPDL